MQKSLFVISLVLCGVFSIPVETPEKRVSFNSASSFSLLITQLPSVVQPGLLSLSMPIFQTSDYKSSDTFYNNWNNFFQNINLGYTQGGLINGALSTWGLSGGNVIYNSFNNIINILSSSVLAVSKLDSGMGAQFNAQYLKIKDYIVNTNNTIAKAVTAWPYAIISTQLGDNAYSNLSSIMQTSAQLMNNMSLFWSNSSANNVYVPYCFDYTLHPMTGVIMLQMNKSTDLYFDFTNASQLYLGDKNITLQGIEWSLDHEFSLRFNNMLSIFLHIVMSCQPVTTSTAGLSSKFN